MLANVFFPTTGFCWHVINYKWGVPIFYIPEILVKHSHCGSVNVLVVQSCAVPGVMHVCCQPWGQRQHEFKIWMRGKPPSDSVSRHVPPDSSRRRVIRAGCSLKVTALVKLRLPRLLLGFLLRTALWMALLFAIKNRGVERTQSY